MVFASLGVGATGGSELFDSVFHGDSPSVALQTQQAQDERIQAESLLLDALTRDVKHLEQDLREERQQRIHGTRDRYTREEAIREKDRVDTRLEVIESKLEIIIARIDNLTERIKNAEL